MNHIVLLVGLSIVLLIVFKIIAGIASFVFRLVVLLILVTAGYLLW
ncbi:MAG: hypothetical protein AB7G75_01220 [Candidatus Binatia bacterium]